MNTSANKKEIQDKIKNALLTGLPAVTLALVAGQSIFTAMMTMLVMPLLPVIIDYLFKNGFGRLGLSTTLASITITEASYVNRVSYINPDYESVLSYLQKLYTQENKHIKSAVKIKASKLEWYYELNQKDGNGVFHIDWRCEKTDSVHALRFSLKNPGKPGDAGCLKEINLMGENLNVLHQFLNTAKSEFPEYVEKAPKEGTKRTCFVERFDADAGWKTVGNCIGKTFETVFLQEQARESIINDLEIFKSLKSKATTLGVPYKRSYLFWGAPGCGKSSIARAIANYMQMDLYSLELNKLKAKQLEKAIQSLHGRVVLLLDDIDISHVTWSRESQDLMPPVIVENNMDGDNAIDLGLLLRILDGYENLNGCVVIMNTNHPEKLDSALTREGRVDYKVEIKSCNFEQLKDIALAVFDSAEIVEKILEGIDSEKFEQMQFKVAEVLNVWMLSNFNSWERARSYILKKVNTPIK